MRFLGIGRRSVPDAHQPAPREVLVEKITISSTDLKARISRLESLFKQKSASDESAMPLPLIDHRADSEESVKLFVMGGNAFKSLGESDMSRGHKPIANVIKRFTLDLDELDEASVKREIEAASLTIGVETYIKYRTNYADGAEIVDYGKADLFIVKLVSNGSEQ